jgi:hypothetical protein
MRVLRSSLKTWSRSRRFRAWAFFAVAFLRAEPKASCLANQTAHRPALAERSVFLSGCAFGLFVELGVKSGVLGLRPGVTC